MHMGMQTRPLEHTHAHTKTHMHTQTHTRTCAHAHTHVHAHVLPRNHTCVLDGLAWRYAMLMPNVCPNRVTPSPEATGFRVDSAMHMPHSHSLTCTQMHRHGRMRTQVWTVHGTQVDSAWHTGGQCMAHRWTVHGIQVDSACVNRIAVGIEVALQTSFNKDTRGCVPVPTPTHPSPPLCTIIRMHACMHACTKIRSDASVGDALVGG